MLDLDYAEDSTAEADANFVLAASGGIVEIQVTAEEAPLAPDARARPLQRLAGERDRASSWRCSAAALGLSSRAARRFAGDRLVLATPQ